MATRIGFVGIGHMGLPMVQNLLKAGFAVTVFDLNKQALEQAAQNGAKIALDIATLAQNQDFVFTMLQSGEQVKSCCLDDDGIFAHLSPNTLFIDSSTIDIETSRLLHKQAEQKNIAMLDAPVSGGVGGAQAATLTFMVGGTETDFQRALPILNHMGKKILHAGDASCGTAAKICNNLILAVSMIGTCEGLALAENLGLDLKKFYAIASVSSAQCWSLNQYCPAPNVLPNVPSSHDYQPGFTARLMLKDLKLGQSAAQLADSEIPLGNHAIQLYERLVQQYAHTEIDFSAIFKWLQQEVV